MLMMCFSFVFSNSIFYANTTVTDKDKIVSIVNEYGIYGEKDTVTHETLLDEYKYIVGIRGTKDLFVLGFYGDDICAVTYANDENRVFKIIDTSYWVNGSDGGTIYYHKIEMGETGSISNTYNLNQLGGDTLTILYSDFDIYSYDGGGAGNCVIDYSVPWFPAGSVSDDVPNSSIGYLQNVKRERQYTRAGVEVFDTTVPLLSYDDSTLKYVWKYDSLSTSGIDLTSGDYAVRHYVKEATVSGYEKEDIVEMSDMYFMGEYDASLLRFEYLEKEHDAKLKDFGYDGLSFIDKYLKGYFQLEHHYLQIVNTSTNEVGGYLHLYPKDSTGAFGVEMNQEGLTSDFEIDPSGPNGVIDESTGVGNTYEEAEVDASRPKLNDLSGINEVVEVLTLYGTQVDDVANGIGALLTAFPPWINVLIGIGVVVLFVVICIKALRG